MDTPYKYLLAVEKAFSPPDLQAHDPELQVPVGTRDFRPIPWERLFQKVMHINSIDVNGQEMKKSMIDSLERLFADVDRSSLQG